MHGAWAVSTTQRRGTRGLPAAVDTPIYQRAANYLGHGVRPIRPLFCPAKVARTVLGLVHRPRRQAYVGFVGPLVRLQDPSNKNLNRCARASGFFLRSGGQHAQLGAQLVFNFVGGFYSCGGNVRRPVLPFLRTC